MVVTRSIFSILLTTYIVMISTSSIVSPRTTGNLQSISIKSFFRNVAKARNEGQLIAILKHVDKFLTSNETLERSERFNSSMVILYELIIDKYNVLNQFRSFPTALEMMSEQNHIIHVLDTRFWVIIPDKINLKKISKDIKEIIMFVVDKILKPNVVNPQLNLFRYLSYFICMKMKSHTSLTVLVDLMDYYHNGNDSAMITRTGC